MAIGFVQRRAMRLLLRGVCMWFGLVAVVNSAEFPFRMSWDERPPELIEHMAGANEVAAGSRGYVVASGDKLVYEQTNDEARFWGVGLTFSGKRPWKFPPEKKDAVRLVKKLRSLGFNHVRFVGFDNGAPEPFRAWIRNGRVDSETMDRFDYFVSELRKAGIYYSISINNSGVLLLDSVEGVAPNSSAQMPLWRYKYLRLFEDQAVSRIVAWYTGFYAHVNPYTKLSYARDPANIYVSSANEDSIFEPFFQDFRILDDSHRKSLERKFSDFLGTRYGSMDVALERWSSAGGGYCDRAAIAAEGRNPRVLGASQLKLACQRRIEDTIGFLIDIDGYAATRIKEALDVLGYRGLFSVTNNWYGYGARSANERLGDYVDLHGYYGHPKRSKWPVKAESVSARSIIAGGQSLDSIDGEHSYPLSKAFRSASPTQPVLFSEWGVGAWTDFGYEGPLIQMAYSAFQGYPLLDAHTYFNHPDPDPKDTLSRYALTVSGNGVLISLSPSLSLAFRRGDISSPEQASIYRCAATQQEFLRKVLEYGLKRTGMQCGFHANEGYVNKVRSVLYGDKDERVAKQSGPDHSQASSLKSSTAEINWRRGSGRGGASFSVETPRFVAVANPSDGGRVTLSGFDLAFRSHGAITIISLDSRSLLASESILVTTVQSFRNSGMERYEAGDMVSVTDPGDYPMTMRTAEVHVRIPGRRNEVALSLCAVMPDGQLKYVKTIDGAAPAVEFDVGQEATPWYWLGRDPSGRCAAPGVSG